MSEGFQFIDIILFAMIAAFLVFRLHSVLGRRTGHERPPQDFRRGESETPYGDNVVELPTRRPMPPEGPTDPYIGTPLAPGIGAIRHMDPAFAPQDFLRGARGAFEMIVGAYAAGDVQTLQPLLAPPVFANFNAAIEARRAAAETLETELIGFKNVDMIEARLEGTTALVTVQFVTEQVNVLRDRAGTVLEGDPNRIAVVRDIWTFARDTRSADPNWNLVATRSHDEDED